MSYLECPRCGCYQKQDDFCREPDCPCHQPERELNNASPELQKMFHEAWEYIEHLRTVSGEQRARAAQAENERLREKLNHLEDTSCDIDLARHWQTRAEKAELDLQVARHENKMAQEAVLLREADNVALREGLRLIENVVLNFNLTHVGREVLKQVGQLLASDPGAKVRAVVAAVEDKQIALHMDGYDDIVEAVRALRGKEGEGYE